MKNKFCVMHYITRGRTKGLNIVNEFDLNNKEAFLKYLEEYKDGHSKNSHNIYGTVLLREG